MKPTEPGAQPNAARHAAKGAESGERKLWRSRAGRRRASQAFRLVEQGMVDGTTANSLTASYRVPRQDGQIAKTKFLARNCLRILDQGLPANASPLLNKPAA